MPQMIINGSTFNFTGNGANAVFVPIRRLLTDRMLAGETTLVRVQLPGDPVQSALFVVNGGTQVHFIESDDVSEDIELKDDAVFDAMRDFLDKYDTIVVPDFVRAHDD